jgi:hypothetical protein
MVQLIAKARPAGVLIVAIAEIGKPAGPQVVTC